MKVLVKNIKVGFSQQCGGIIILESEKHCLRLFAVPPDAFFGLATVINKEEKPDCDKRMRLSEMLQLIIPKNTVSEVFINGTIKTAFTADITVNGETKQIIPSVAVFLAKVLNVPIYFESDLAEETNNTMIV